MGITSLTDEPFHAGFDRMPDVGSVVRDRVTLPSDSPAGVYPLSPGICRPGGEQPAVKMANAKRDSDGWLPVTEMTFA